MGHMNWGEGNEKGENEQRGGLGEVNEVTTNSYGDIQVAREGMPDFLLLA